MPRSPAPVARPIPVGVRLPADVAQAARDRAAADRRSLTSLIELALVRFLQETGDLPADHPSDGRKTTEPRETTPAKPPTARRARRGG